MEFDVPDDQLDPHLINNLIELLEKRAALQKDLIAFTFLHDDHSVETISYLQLAERARAIAAELQKMSQMGDRVILIYPPGLDLIAAYFGCLYAGVIAVPVYPPANPSLVEKLQRIILDCQPSLILSTKDIEQKIRKLRLLKFASQTPIIKNIVNRYLNKKLLLTEWDINKLEILTTDNVSTKLGREWHKPVITGDHLAFLQYTSGSTGHPKGVMVSHENLLSNSEQIFQGFGHTTDNVCVIWLPPYHDMGLIGGILQPLYAPYTCILMSPMQFLKNPYIWLKTITDYKGTLSGAPNFAYDYCVKRIDEEHLKQLDLSSWRTAFNGAEPISKLSLDRFHEKFKTVGFNKNAFFPCYGLAEATLFVSGAAYMEGYQSYELDAESLKYHHVEQPSNSKKALSLVSSGLIYQDVHIINPDNFSICKPNKIGEIWITGSSVAKGYWNKPQETSEVFQAHLTDDNRNFLRTGDLGFISADNELVVTGRIKDLIIIHGKNLYPHDIEQIVSDSHKLVRVGCCAAFSVESDAEEHLVVVAEVSDSKENSETKHIEICEAIASAVENEFEIATYSIILISPRKLPKTTSGKIRRRYTKELLESERLDFLYKWEHGKSKYSDKSHIVLPQNEIEAELLTIYKELFDSQDVGITDNFLSLGGDSLLAMQLIARIETKWQISLEPHLFFENPTLQEIAQVISSEVTKRATDTIRHIKLIKQERPKYLPLSYSQTRLWFLNQLYPNNAFYNLLTAIEFKGDLIVENLSLALNKIIERHEILRTVFLMTDDGVPYQKIIPYEAQLINLKDLSQINLEIQSETIAEYIKQEGERPFDLSKGPLLRIEIIKLSPEKHVLLIVAHHIITDGWSLQVLANDLSNFYNTLYQGKEIHAPHIDLQYADFALWQQSVQTSELLEKQVAYWEAQLKGAPSLINLPIDKPRPVVSSYNGKRFFFKIDKQTTEVLKLFAHDNHVSLYMLLLSVFFVFLHRYSQDDDIVVGSPAANRIRPEFENLIGFFVNTLALRCHIDSHATFKDILQQVKTMALAALSFQDTPFEQIVKKLNVERHLNYTPLFQVMFILNNQPSQINLSGIESKQYLDAVMAKFDLTLECTEEEDGINCCFEYASDLFEETTIERMTKHWFVLLEEIITNPIKKVAELSILTKAETQQILYGWNDTKKNYPKEKLIHELFEEQVEKTPNNIAVVFEDQQLTYKELNERSNQLAYYLKKQGVKAEALVAVCMERSVELIIVLLGILKAGGAYVPLDPEYPSERLEYMLTVAKPEFLLTQNSLLNAHPGLNQKENLLILEILNQDLNDLPTQNIKALVSPKNSAYIIFTSGSTGKPKGIIGTHQGILNRMQALWELYPYEAGEIGCQKTSLNFVDHVAEIFSPFLCGLKLMMLSNQAAKGDVKELITELNSYGISRLTIVPSLLQSILDYLNETKFSMPTLRYIYCSGEASSVSLVKRFYELQPETKLINLYGSSEISADVTVYETSAVDMNLTSANKSIEIDLEKYYLSLGKPLANNFSYILDKKMQLLPLNVTGELYVAGEGLARGYLNRPDLTAERFVANPFATEEDVRTGNTRLYRTGDLCRWLSDGNIEYVGRIDHQVKIRGFRIELGEIESALSNHEHIKEAIVLAREDEPGQKRLVAYYVLKDSTLHLIATDLRDYLSQSLPSYMIPSLFMVLEQMPLTPNGKLDRKALPIPENTASEGYVAPSQLLEQQLVEIWESILHTSPIGVKDNFFDRGGHSLLATQVISRIRTTLKQELPLQELFKYPTIEGTVKYLKKTLSASTLSEINIIPRNQPIPLSYAQQRLWFLDQLEPGSAQYNIPITLKLEGELNIGALEYALNKMIERHEVLRTTFVMKDSEAFQAIALELNLQLEVEDSEDEEVAKRRIHEEIQKGFDLAKGPLIRAHLFKISPSIHFFLLNVHHSISDGWSMGIMAHEIGLLYESTVNHTPVHMKDLPIQYADFSVWQREYLSKGKSVYERQLKYWQEELEDSPRLLELPLDHVRPAVQSGRGETLSFELTEELTKGLKTLSRENGSTLFMTLLAAFYVLLWRYSGQEDIVIGSPIANRHREEVEGLIGFFVNTLALRGKINSQQNFNEFLKATNQKTLTAYENQDLPFEQLVDHLQVERSLSHSPLFQVMFIFQNILNSEIKLSNLILKREHLTSSTSKFDLTLEIFDSETGLVGSLEYASDLFEKKTIERFIEHFKILLTGIVKAPENKLSELPLLTREEEYQILFDWNNTQQNYPKDQTIHELFEKQVKKIPNNIAVVYENQQLTYQELNDRSNRFAHWLLEHGLTSNKLVAVCMKRSVDLIVTLLGILKAGCAYMPLDPDYPQERLEHMLAMAKPDLLVTQVSILEAHRWLEGHKKILYGLESIVSSLNEFSNINPEVCTPAKSAAYVIYTSGSTGKPKGIIGTHLGIVNRLRSIWEIYPYEEYEVCCQKTSLNFVDHVAELFSPLLMGLKLVILSESSAKGDVESLIKELDFYKISRITLVPSLLRAILDYQIQSDFSLSTLRYIFCSGEALPVSLIKKFYECFTKVKLINLYGSSEVSADVTYYKTGTIDVDFILPYFSKSLEAVKNMDVWQNAQVITTSNVSLQELKETFNQVIVPEQPCTWEEYLSRLKNSVLPHIVNTTSPYFIGHMTSALPIFNQDLSQLITLLNQNVVKVETSKSLTLLEREAIAMMHQTIYKYDEEFYKQYSQDASGELGSIVSGGTLANILALWIARNQCLPPADNFLGVAEEGMLAALKYWQYTDAVILVSPLMHYSIKKAASLLGVGEKNIVGVALDEKGQIDLGDLKQKIQEYKEKHVCIIALIAIAGATETGSIDPIDSMADIAEEAGIYLHVDAAFGGPIIFSKAHGYLLKGIDRADSVAICGHKQLYLPMGISICLFKHRNLAKNIYVTADYQSTIGSLDSGKSNPEGSRPAFSLFLHANLHLLGKTGYANLIDKGIKSARYLQLRIKKSKEFELLWEPTINIVNYRYIPVKYRELLAKGLLTEKDNEAISTANLALQAEEFVRGKTFISKTWLPYLKGSRGEEVVSLRAVIANPLTSSIEINTVLDDQILIAREIIEGEKIQLPAKEEVYASQQDELILEKHFALIGKPISNSEVYILNFQMQPAPINVIGELYVAGDGLAQGYIGAPELTAERFIANPFATEADVKTGNTRLYKTGDLCRWLVDGNIEYLGRIDHQVKIRGFRIELGEVESVLLSYEHIKEAVVLAREDEPGQKRLVAYYVLKNLSLNLSSADLRDYLSKSLPDYMIPTVFIALEQMPLTPNGKLDRKALPIPGLNGNEGYIAPSRRLEQQLVEIWEEVLHASSIGIRDNFFERGGHSLLATQVVSRIRAILGKELPLQELFKHPTIEGLTRYLEEESETSQLTPIIPADRTQPIPLSYAQERLWFIDQLNPGNAQYNIPVTLRLEGKLNILALESAINEVVKRHEVLRTTFVMKDDEVYQIIAPDLALKLTVENSQNEASAKQQINEIVHQGFNLSEGPLIRAALFKISDQSYLFLLNVHHSVSDGWSMNLLAQEIGQLYASIAYHAPINLKVLPIQYADFAVWQREYLSKGKPVYERQLKYWKEELANSPRLLDLPFDHARPLMQSSKGETISFELPKELSEGLKRISRENEVTLFMTLLAAFYVLLWRYSGQEDIVLGSPIANRHREEVEALIGFFVNILALRVEVKPNISFNQFLKEIKRKTLLAYENQDIPFEHLVDHLKVERSLSHSPLFQVMFVLQNNSKELVSLTNLTLKMESLDYHLSKFDLTLNMSESEENLIGFFEYVSDLFDRETIVRLIDHFKLLLESIIAQAENKISELPLLTKAEEGQILNEWNDTKKDYPKEKVISELFEEQVEKTPDNIAVIFENRQLTYKELNEKSNQVAHYLKKKGVKADTLVAVCMDRSIDLISALLGILKAGGAYVPLDPEYPKDRLKYMLEDSNSTLLITQEKFRKHLPELSSVKTIILDGIQNELKQESKLSPRINVLPENLAYVIYTSGSTGKPKGTLIRQCAISRLVFNQNYIVIKEADVIAQASNVSFDAATFEIWGALLHGAKLVILPLSQILSYSALKQVISRYEITIMWITASLFNQLYDADSVLFDGMRFLLIGGEALSLKRVQQFIRTSNCQYLVNGYGPTENTTFSVCNTMKVDHDGEEITRISLGKSINNTFSYILTSDYVLQSVGAIGELYLGGVGLARGYLNRPDLTAERFIANPFATEEDVKSGNTRLYKTGDLCRWLGDGNIEYVGRIDYQVKIRGFRIELGEIESVLLSYEQIKEVVVLAREDESGQKRLVAYYVLKDPTLNLTTADIRDYLGKSLPDYLVPSVFMPLEQIPLTPNGKLDRKALPTPEMGASEGYVAPNSLLEQQLVDIWENVLQASPIGIRDNFFERGGHSLLATQVVSRIRTVLGKELSLQELFKRPTIEGIENYLEKEGMQSTLSEIKVIPRYQPIPLSYAQQRLWFLEQLEPGNAQYNIPATLRLEGELNVLALEQALNEIIKRHEVLRTTFVLKEGEAYQVIAPEATLKLMVEDCENEEDAKQRISEETQKGFNLSQGLLIRANLFKLNNQSYLFLLNVHHSITDGWSMGIMAREISQIYESIVHHTSLSLKDLPIQYADFAVWQREYLSEGKAVYDGQLTYWQTELADSPMLLELPLDIPRPAIQSGRGASVSFELSKELTQELKQLSQDNSATLFMTLLSAFYILLWRYSGQNDIVIGSPIANRHREEVEELIGFFVNTLALRAKVKSNFSFIEFLKIVKQKTLMAYENQDMPFEHLVDHLKIERSLSYSPLFQVMFSLQNMEQIKIELSDLTLKTEFLESNISKFDLSLDMAETEEGLKGQFEYSTDLFEKQTIVRLADHFKILLKRIVISSKDKLSNLSLLSHEEEQKILYDWNDTKKEFAREKTIQELFEYQAKKAPENIAGIFEGQILTYKELNEQSNQLAHYLQKKGVKADTLVAVCRERSLEFIVTLLGIVKAGGAYVPLDSAYPKERLEYMLEDSKAKYLITQEKFKDHLPNLFSVSTIVLEEILPILKQESKISPEINLSSQNLAYVIYTSGSTGKPKGVGVSHQGLVNLMGVYRDWFKVSSVDKIGQYHSYSFDSFGIDIWPALTHGASLFLIEAEARFSAEEVRDFIVSKEITLIDLPTALAKELFRLSWPSHTKLRTLKLGGEKILSVEELNYPFDIWNTYGPTEATVEATGQIIYDSAHNRNNYPNASPPIGKLMRNVKAYILNADLFPSPSGVGGELYIGGVGLARGYLNKPDLTAERFIANPYATEEDVRAGNTRLYKTGDLCRWLSDGNIEYVGRIDHQVKIRGFRIELGEIESSLSSHEQIKEAVVLAREDEPGQKRLVAYYVLKEKGSSLSVSDLKEYLGKSLPDYMVPSAFMALEAMPLMPNGKLDRKALPAPEYVRVEFTAARNEIEEKLVEIWQKVLHVDSVSVLDNFFELGGDSIISIQIISRANEQGMNLKAKDIFQSPTIAGLALMAEERKGHELRVSETTGEVPLSAIQHWFFESEYAEPSHWNQSLLLKLPKDVNKENIESAIKAAFQNHPNLFMHYRKEKEEVIQAYGTKEAIEIETIYLREADKEKEQERKANKLQGSLNLGGGPLFRIALFEGYSDRQLRLLMIIHHLVVDGVSWRILLEEIKNGYEQKRRGEEITLTSELSSFKDWEKGLIELTKGELIQNQKDYWLSRPDTKPLPKDKEGEATQESIVTEEVILSEEETEQLLREVPQAYHTQINDILLTGLVLALRDWTGEKETTIHLEGHGREELIEDIDISRTVGWFTSMYPVYLSIPSDNLGETIKHIKEQLRAVPLKGIGYGLLRYLAKDEELNEALKQKDKHQIVFNYLGQLESNKKFYGKVDEAAGLDIGRKNKTDEILSINGGIVGDQLMLKLSYSVNQYVPETIKKLSKSYTKHIRALISHCMENKNIGFTPSDFPLAGLTQEELDKFDELT